jgi:hypothetical protein
MRIVLAFGLGMTAFHIFMFLIGYFDWRNRYDG